MSLRCTCIVHPPVSPIREISQDVGFSIPRQWRGIYVFQNYTEIRRLEHLGECPSIYSYQFNVYMTSESLWVGEDGSRAC